MDKLYIAGEMLKKGNRRQRMAEFTELNALNKYDIYNPMANKDINDKAVLPVQGLAEKIVEADTARLLESDIVVIEPHNDACGTMVELGQLLGWKQMAEAIMNCTDLEEAMELCQKQLERKVYAHYEDVRLEGDTGNGFRSTVGINAYVTGTCIELTGKPDGFQSWESIVNELT